MGRARITERAFTGMYKQSKGPREKGGRTIRRAWSHKEFMERAWKAATLWEKGHEPQPRSKKGKQAQSQVPCGGSWRLNTTGSGRGFGQISAERRLPVGACGSAVPGVLILSWSVSWTRTGTWEQAKQISWLFLSLQKMDSPNHCGPLSAHNLQL